MKFSTFRFFLYLLSFSFILTSCKDKWEEHNSISDELSTISLLAEINANPQLSKFSELLTKTGYDQVLAASKSFTVWAPTNEALAAIDPALIDTQDELMAFVGNHIANQSLLTINIKHPYINVRTLNGKNVSFTKTSADDAELIAKDRYVGNGVLHVISSAIIPKLNAWEFLLTTSTLQKNTLLAYSETVFDASQAKKIGVDPNTGKDIYEPGSGMITYNKFLTADRNRNISNEDSVFTYIVLTDEAFLREQSKLRRYFAAGDSTDSITNYNIVKDLAFKGILDSDNFPADAYSAKDSVRFHLLKSDVVEKHRVSNGVVYVMKDIHYDMGNNGIYDKYAKLKPIVIEAENFVSALNASLNRENVTRILENPNTNKVFKDILIQNHGTANYWVRLEPSSSSVVYSTNYNVYWVAVNDFQEAEFDMKLTFFRSNATDFSDYKKVKANDYSEVFLGNYPITKLYSATTASGRLPVYVVGANTTDNAINKVVLDYVKLVPSE